MADLKEMQDLVNSIKIEEMTIEEYFDVVVEDLGTFFVELDDDPLQQGPSALNEKIAQCRRYVDKCEKYAQFVSVADARTRRILRTLQAEFNLRHDDLYANDPKVRAGRSEKEREALINMKLQDLVEYVSIVDTLTLDLKNLATIIKSSRTNLKDTEMRIKDQMSLCMEDIKLGSSWGASSVLDSETTELIEKGLSMADVGRRSFYDPDAFDVNSISAPKNRNAPEDPDEKDDPRSFQAKMSGPDIDDVLKNI